jgi:hypothetical protein
VVAKVELSVATLYRLLGQLDLGEPHPLFTGGERYYSPRLRQEADAEFRAALIAAGVIGRDGLDQGFVELLTVMQRGQVEYYGWLHDAEGPYSVLTAAAGRVGVLAERIEDTVTFEAVEAGRLLDAFLYRLPSTPPARGEALSVRVRDLAESDGFPRRLPPPARRLEALLKTERTGGGKLYTARRDPRGKRVRATAWVDVIDVAAGRWALYRVAGGGEPFVTAVPGTTQVIGKRLSELQSGLH